MMHSAAEVEERVPPPVKASSPGAVPDGAGVAMLDGKRDEQVKLADELFAQLKANGVDVCLDDRPLSPGAKFKDLELIGIPHRITVGDRGLKEGMVEYQARRAEAASKIALADIVAHVRGALA